MRRRSRGKTSYDGNQDWTFASFCILPRIEGYLQRPLRPLCINVEVSESFKRRTVGETGAKSRSDVGKRVIQAARTRFELSRCHDPSAVLHWNNALLSLPSPGMAGRTKKSHSVVVAGW